MSCISHRASATHRRQISCISHSESATHRNQIVPRYPTVHTSILWGAGVWQGGRSGWGWFGRGQPRHFWESDAQPGFYIKHPHHNGASLNILSTLKMVITHATASFRPGVAARWVPAFLVGIVRLQMCAIHACFRLHMHWAIKDFGNFGFLFLGPVFLRRFNFSFLFCTVKIRRYGAFIPFFPLGVSVDPSLFQFDVVHITKPQVVFLWKRVPYVPQFLCPFLVFWEDRQASV